MNPFPPQPATLPHAMDAIVVVPGIMGSALKVGKDLIWGFTTPKPYLTLWGPGAGMTPLALTPAELDAIAEGTYDPQTARVQPAGLIRFSAFAPLTGGFEPYTRLARALKTAAAHPDAVLEFAYDWRLPTRLNSRLLARAMRQHLTRWRAHEAHAAARRLHPEQRDAEIIIVAHSMGGLVARGLADPTIDNGFDNVRQVITLGTPFFGSVKVAVMLERGEGAIPLPRRRLGDVARTIPGLYDLLPRNRCLLTHHDTIDDVVAMTVDDVVAIGGNRQLAEAASRDFASTQAASLPGHRAVVGIAQPTWSSLHIRNGTVGPASVAYHFDRDGALMCDDIGRAIPYDDGGDGTVWRYAARPQGALAAAEPVAQQHGALASSGDTIKAVVGMVTDLGDLGVHLGGGVLGLDAPDVVVAGAPLTLTVTGEADPARVSCRVIDLTANDLVRKPGLRSDGEGRLQATLSLSDEGLYHVEVKGEAGDWVTQVVMVTAPES